MVSLQYELSYVRANKMIGKTTYCTGGRHVVSHQCVLLNVSANEMIGKRTSYTWGRNEVSHQYELSYEFSDSLTLQMILCIWYNLLISWYSALSNFVARCRNLLKTLCSARHQLLLLVCLEFGRFPSAPPVFQHNQSQVHLEYSLLPQKANKVSILFPPYQSLLHI